jgi:hypothetical protein
MRSSTALRPHNVTKFRIIGVFTRKSRPFVGQNAPVNIKEFRISLKDDLSLEDVQKLTHADKETIADTEALKHCKSSPREKVWLTDWELVSYTTHAE